MARPADPLCPSPEPAASELESTGPLPCDGDFLWEKNGGSDSRYYAFGEVNDWTSHLTPPQWYVDLADTPEERQALYREFCDQYYRDELLPEREEVENGCAFGSARFMDHRERFLRGVMARIRDGSIPRRTLDRWVMNHLARQIPKTCGESRPPP